MANGRVMMVDYAPSEDGRVRLHNALYGDPVSEVLGKGVEPEEGEALYTPHAATCRRPRHRRPAAAGPSPTLPRVRGPARPV